ncbi:restriction endonuclease subunit S [Soonwooa sp.]|uniref:restriction endonuclease subunit S n=1 Tax=Soonwooa sp. TaxID=1938592 RepID=UPI0028AABB54|nr:restriction endonuclease subunit S [Soonwooa sp.]
MLIGRQNIHNGGIGIVNEMQSGNICSNAISSFVVNEKNDLKFIFIKLSTPFVYKRIENFMGGTGQKELSENEWLKLEIKIPEKSEQKAISKILDTASSELKHYEEKLTNLKLQKKGMMQQLLTGKVRVKI